MMGARRLHRGRAMVDRPVLEETDPPPRLLARTKRPDLPALPGTSWHADVVALRTWIEQAKADPEVDPYWVDQASQPLQEKLAAPGARRAYRPTTPEGNAP